jgi:hypothetical protein
MRRELFALGLLAALSALVLVLAYQLPGEIFLDLGPNDGRYVWRFREDFEIDEPTLIHWSTKSSEIRLPFHLRGPYEVTLRYKRHVAIPAELRVLLGGRPVDTLAVPQQDFTLRTFRDPNPDGGSFVLGLVATSVDPRPLGIALDWVLVRPSGFGGATPTASALVQLGAWVVLFYLFARLLDLRRSLAFAVASAVLAAVAATAVVHKLWPLHVASTLGWRIHALVLLLALFVRFRRSLSGSFFAGPEARWAVLIVGLALAARLFALFHPDYYYPDVRTHSKFVSILWTDGFSSFLSDYVANQHRHLLGLQLVGERWVAFPYPPLLYLTVYPLSLLQLPVDDWMKLVPTALLSVEALVVFVVARRLGCAPRTALFAVLLHSTARVLAFRLAVASFAALYGHFWDSIALLFLALFYDRLEKPLYGAGLGLLVGVSLLSYAGSVLVLGLFVPLLAAALALTRSEPPPPSRVLAIALWPLAAALLAAALFYWQYVPELLGTGTGGGEGVSALVDASFTPIAALAMAGRRLWLFYGVFGGVAAAALVTAFVRRTWPSHSLTIPLALAASGTYLGMNVLRAGLGETHIFQFSKDDLVILPLVVVLLGSLARRMVERGHALRAAGALLLVAWVSWGFLSLASDVERRFLRPDYPVETR